MAKSRMPRYGGKRDENEPELVKQLRGCGVFVMLISEPKKPDMMCYYHGRWFILETKMPKGKATKNQNWDETIEPGAIPFVRTLDEALRAIGAIT